MFENLRTDEIVLIWGLIGSIVIAVSIIYFIHKRKTKIQEKYEQKITEAIDEVIKESE